jgi:hypothetical protein
MDRITTTIKLEWLGEIAAGRKRVEYREIKPYWIRRLSKIEPPFELRPINGMQSKAPELTVVVQRVRKNSRSGFFELLLGKVVDSGHAALGCQTRAAIDHFGLIPKLARPVAASKSPLWRASFEARI